MKSVKFILYILIFANPLFSQNLIPNSSFEAGWDVFPNRYDAELHKVHDWENFGTSDWYHSYDLDNYLGTFDKISPVAHHGDAYLGFGPCEGGQVELIDDNYDKDPVYWFMTTSFYYRTRLDIYSEINYYLFRDKYKGNDPNDENWLEDCYDDSPFLDGVKGTLDIEQGHHDKWYYYDSQVASGQTLPLVKNYGNDPYSWFAIKGSNISGFHQHQSYVFVDQIRVDLIDYCDHPCANQGEEITAFYGERQSDGTIKEVFDPEIVNGVSDFLTEEWIPVVTLDDVNYVKLIIANRWGEVEVIEWFDPLGLKNSSYNIDDFEDENTKQLIQSRPNLFTVVWDGRLNGNKYPDLNVYTVKLEVKNCRFTKYAEWSLTQEGENDDHGMPRYAIPNTISSNCCTPGQKIYVDSLDEKETLDQIQGQIHFKDSFVYDGDFDYKGESGESIHVMNGSNIRANGESHFQLGINRSCTVVDEEESAQGKKKKNYKKVITRPERISIYPNPSENGKVYFNSYLEFEEISAVTISGSEVSISIIGNQISFDYPNNSGLFILRFNVKGEIIHKKILLK